MTRTQALPQLARLALARGDRLIPRPPSTQRQREDRIRAVRNGLFILREADFRTAGVGQNTIELLKSL
jgi:hypothetical protein